MHARLLTIALSCAILAAAASSAGACPFQASTTDERAQSQTAQADPQPSPQAPVDASSNN